MEKSQQNEHKTAGTRGKGLTRSKRSLEQHTGDFVQDEKKGPEKSPADHEKRKATNGKGVAERVTLQTKVAAEGAVSVWMQKEDLKAKKDE